MEKKKVVFICVHNSCRSQIAEALGKHLIGDCFECYSAGTEVKSKINQDPTGKSDEVFKSVIKEIEKRIFELKEKLYRNIEQEAPTSISGE